MLQIANTVGTGSIRTKDPDLSQRAVDWLMESPFVARSVMSLVPSQSIDGSYAIYNRETQLRQTAGPVTAEGVRVRAESELERLSFRCRAWGLMGCVNDFTAAQAMGTGVDPELHETMNVTEGLGRRIEKSFTDLAFDADNWNASAVGADADTAGDFDPYDASKRSISKVTRDQGSGASVVRDGQSIRLAMMRRTGYAPNTAVLGANVAHQALNNPDVIDYLNRGQTSGFVQAQLSDLATAWRIENVLVMESLSEQGSFFNENDALFLYRDLSPGVNGVTAMSLYSWDAFKDGADLAVESFYSQDRGQQLVRGTVAYDMGIVSKDLGCVVKGWA